MDNGVLFDAHCTALWTRHFLHVTYDIKKEVKRHLGMEGVFPTSQHGAVGAFPASERGPFSFSSSSFFCDGAMVGGYEVSEEGRETVLCMYVCMYVSIYKGAEHITSHHITSI